jgi:hypothetical protein
MFLICHWCCVVCESLLSIFESLWHKRASDRRFPRLAAYDYSSVAFWEGTGGFFTDHCEGFISGSWRNKHILRRNILQVGSTAIGYISYFRVLMPVLENFVLFFKRNYANSWHSNYLKESCQWNLIFQGNVINIVIITTEGYIQTLTCTKDHQLRRVVW